MEKSQKVPIRRKKKKLPAAAARRKYEGDIKNNAARYYIMGLSLPEISKLLDGIPIRTLEKWQLSQKWTNLKSPTNIKQHVLELKESGKTMRDIAAIVGKSEKTVYRWIQAATEKSRLESNHKDI